MGETVVSAGADGVSINAVGAEDLGEAVHERQGVAGTGGVAILAGARLDVVGLVGGVATVTPEETGDDWEMLV